MTYHLFTIKISYKAKLWELTFMIFEEQVFLWKLATREIKHIFQVNLTPVVLSVLFFPS